MFDIKALLAEGASNKVIARRLGISIHTAKFHVASLLDKLDAVGRTDAVAHAARAFAAVPSSISVSLGSPSPVLHPPNYEPIVDLDEGVIVQVQTIVGQRLHRPFKINAGSPKDLSNPRRKKALGFDGQVVRHELPIQPGKVLQRFDCRLDRRVVSGAKAFLVVVHNFFPPFVWSGDLSGRGSLI
jgi:hypothetical protein